MKMSIYYLPWFGCPQGPAGEIWVFLQLSLHGGWARVGTKTFPFTGLLSGLAGPKELGLEHLGLVGHPSLEQCGPSVWALQHRGFGAAAPLP